jgi:hypothetical protein
MASNITIGVDVDDTQANQKLITLQTKVDEQVQQWNQQFKLTQTEITTTNTAIDTTVQQWRIKRLEIQAQLSALNQSIGLLIRAVRLGAEATGQTIKPYQNAILNMIQSTTSIMLATSAAMQASGVLALAGLVLAGFAYGFSMVQTANIMATSEELQRDFDDIIARLRELENQGRMPLFAGRTG